MSSIRPFTRAARRALTLPEILVVIAIIMLLLSILLPDFRRAREQAKAVKCAGTFHTFGTGLAVYAAEDNEWIPGRNTSGAEIWRAQVESMDFIDDMRMSRPGLPVQTYDWMTPILRTTTELPANRAERFRVLLDYYRCPSVKQLAVLYSHARPRDQDIFRDNIAEFGPFPAISYLMPVHFQYWGHDEPEQDIDCYVGSNFTTSFPVGRSPFPFTPYEWEVRVLRYKSKVSQVGPPAAKIAVADGTRYLPRICFLDFDHSAVPEPDYFGSFASAGGWWRGSIAYGDDQRIHPNNSGGKNIPLSFRHYDGLEALFFDGHAERLSRKQARRVDYWYPRGGEVVKADEGYTDWREYANGYIIP